MQPFYTGSNRTARAYYNSHDSGEFYPSVWGGENIHLGIYKDKEASISDARHRTFEQTINLRSTNQG